MSQRPSFPAKLPSGMPQTGARDKLATPSQAIKPASRASSLAIKNRAFSADSLPATALKSIKNSPSKAAFSAPSHGAGLDSAAVRASMVRKLAEIGISNQDVLSAMNRIERHRFVDTALMSQAYEDTSLPIGFGQTISKPSVVARMLSLLLEGCASDEQGKIGRVLEIGGGCGYQAAVLSLLAKEVYSIERLRGLYEKAIDNVRHLKAANLHLILGDGMLGHARGAPYAGIIAAAGGDAIPKAWVEQLAVGGRIVAPMATTDAVTTSSPKQRLMVLDKTPQGVQQTVLEDVLFVPLKSGIV